MTVDTSFIELTYPSILARIDIDPRLKKAFVRVMKRLQEYFNIHNYSRSINYRFLFDDYILTNDPTQKMRFVVSSEPSRYGFAGFYNGSKNIIVIDEKYLNSDELEKILCHEIIHFLTMHRLIKDNVTDPKYKEIRNGGFTNEAYAEMLTLDIYPDGKIFSGYAAQVKMLEFANVLCGSINRYRSFLCGYVDINVLRGKEKNWRAKMYESDYYKNTSLYQEKAEFYSYENAVESHYYINAQRSLILGVLETIDTFDEYFEILKILPNCPVLDYDFLTKVLSRKEKVLVDKMHIRDMKFKKTLLVNLECYRASTMRYYQKFVELPFDNGFVRYVDNDDYIIYIDSKPCEDKRILRNPMKIFKDGIYKYYYVIDGRQYYTVVNKEDIYSNLLIAESHLFRQLKAVNSNGTIDENYYYLTERLTKSEYVVVPGPYGLEYQKNKKRLYNADVQMNNAVAASRITSGNRRR